MIRDAIERALRDALKEKGIEVADVPITVPEEPLHGDYATSAALAHAKKAGIPPRELAEHLQKALSTVEGVEKVEIAGPGYVNVTLAPTVLAAVAENVIKDGTAWGSNIRLKGKTVMLEYTDPNPFKVFHIGHLMSNAVGESLSRLTEFTGAQVIRVNYQGDVGIHVACAVWGIQQLGSDTNDVAELGKAYAHGATAYKENPKAKEEIDALNKIIYDRTDEKINAIYDAGRMTSLRRFDEIYARLGTKFDHFFFESEIGPIGKNLVEEHPDIFPLSDGARVFEGEKYGLHTRVFLNSKGLPTYEAKELGLGKTKVELYPQTDILVIITGNEIIEYFKVLKKAMDLVYPEIAQKVRHVPHGMLRLPTGKMSSRTGKVITGESLLEDLVQAARARAKESRTEDVEKLANQIGVAAIKYQILRSSASRDVIFDQSQALSIEGDSGPYIQYTYARAQSVVSAVREAGVEPKVEAPHTELERLVARLLMQFPSIVQRAQQEYAPHHVAQYAGELASLYNSWYAKERVVGTPDAARRAALTEAVAITLKNALWLLGIEAPERM